MERDTNTGMKIMTMKEERAGGGVANRTRITSLAVLTLLAACGGGDSGGSEEAPMADAAEPAAEDLSAVELNIDPALLPEGVTAEMVEEGRELFFGAGVCYTCHMMDAKGGTLAPDLTDDVWLNVDGEYLSIVEVIKTGVSQPVEHIGAMLPRAGMPLTDEQVEALAAYSYMLSRM